MTSRTASIIGGIGRTLIAFGLITLSFAAFQLWGTGLQEAHAQGSLESDFEERLAILESLDVPVTSAPSTTTSPSTQNEPTELIDGSDNSDSPLVTVPVTTRNTVDLALAELLRSEQGSAMGNISIPAIGLDRHIVEGIERDHLRKGPGHYPSTPAPGQPGNAAVAGHRTTYGAPFGDLDLLVPGDEIIVTTLQGTFRYLVMPQVDADGVELGHFIVDSSQVEILEDFGDNRLTLTACHPKYTARQRIVVTAQLVEEPAPLVPTTSPSPTSTTPDNTGNNIDELALDEGNVIGLDENTLDASLGWNQAERTPTILWGALSALVALLAIVAAHFWKRWASYTLASPLFLVALFVCFTHLDRFLPAL